MSGIVKEVTTMRRGVVMLIAGVAVITSLSVSPVFAASRYPVSVGVSYGKWSPSLDAYNLRFLDQNNPSMVNGTPVYIRGVVLIEKPQVVRIQ